MYQRTWNRPTHSPIDIISIIIVCTKKLFPTTWSRGKYCTCHQFLCIQIWALLAMQRVGGRVCDVKGPPSAPLAPPNPAHCISGNMKSYSHTASARITERYASACLSLPPGTVTTAFLITGQVTTLYLFLTLHMHAICILNEVINYLIK
jgi:hypothetical protein